MGYVRTMKAIQRVKPYLDAMVTANRSLVWTSRDAKKLAYHIHNAFATAKEMNLPQYAELKHKFTIKHRADKVYAELAMAVPESGRLTFELMTDALEIVSTIIKHKDTEFDFLFPHASEATTEVGLIRNWADANGYSLDSTKDGLLIKRTVNDSDQV